jgi:hypothetical protein
MCQTVYMSFAGSNDLVIETLGALRAALGVAPVIRAGYPENLPDDCCLCACDVRATAKLARYRVKCGDWSGLTLTPNTRI